MKRGILLAAAALFMLLAPSARADTHTFLGLKGLYPTGGAGEVGPAIPFPSNISVSGLSGTVTKVTATLIGYRSNNPDDTDVVLKGPNGQSVMLLSDTCGAAPGFELNGWTFDDASPFALPDGSPCPSEETSAYIPTNYPPADDLSAAPGGPAPPYLSSLAALAGGTPNGSWGLFAFDDNAGAGAGFEIAGWALTLVVEPPPPVAATTATPPTVSTGQRAAGLAKCKKKKGKKRKKCRKQAALLPA